ncbi:MAG: hypothetical protein IIY17_01095 [Aeriscardovia sp.]|nr:hypothetical protein [Aeriscardovia sp.]
MSTPDEERYLLSEAGTDALARSIYFDAIKQTGRYKVEARLYPQIISEFTVAVTEQ